MNYLAFMCQIHQGTKTLLFFLICLSRVLLMFGQLPPLQALSDFDDALAQSLQNM
jgi:hypothetical protein